MNSKLLEALETIAALYPDKDSLGVSDEWGEAECYWKAIDIARAAIADHPKQPVHFGITHWQAEEIKHLAENFAGVAAGCDSGDFAASSRKQLHAAIDALILEENHD